jgi:hypothetical protein
MVELHKWSAGKILKIINFEILLRRNLNYFYGRLSITIIFINSRPKKIYMKDYDRGRVTTNYDTIEFFKTHVNNLK